VSRINSKCLRCVAVVGSSPGRTARNAGRLRTQAVQTRLPSTQRALPLLGTDILPSRHSERASAGSEHPGIGK